jgi:hypothetical protein
MKPTPFALHAPAYDRPECIETPGGMPQLDPRRMPQLRLACVSEDGARRSRPPLWRRFERLDD